MGVVGWAVGAKPEEMLVLLEVSAGEAAGLLSAGLAVAVARTTVVPAGEVLEGAVTVGVPAVPVPPGAWVREGGEAMLGACGSVEVGPATSG